MANKLDNLKPFDSNQSREEAKINGSKGGKRSGEVRKERKTMREIGRIMADCLVTGGSKDIIKEKFPNLKDEQLTRATELLFKLYQKARKGDVRAFEVFRDTIGEPVGTSNGDIVNGTKIVYVKESDINAYKKHVKDIVDQKTIEGEIE